MGKKDTDQNGLPALSIIGPGRLGTAIGVIAARAGYPVVALGGRHKKSVVQAARSLGASSLKTFFKVIVPLSKEGLLVGGTLVFTGSITAFVTPWLMGGTRVMTLSTLLRQKAIVSLDWSTATVVAVVMFTTTIFVNLILKRIH